MHGAELRRRDEKPAGTPREAVSAGLTELLATNTSIAEDGVAETIEQHRDSVTNGAREEEVLVSLEAAGTDDQAVDRIDDRAFPGEGTVEMRDETRPEADSLMAVHLRLEADQVFPVNVVFVPALAVLSPVHGLAVVEALGVGEVGPRSTCEQDDCLPRVGLDEPSPHPALGCLGDEHAEVVVENEICGLVVES